MLAAAIFALVLSVVPTVSFSAEINWFAANGDWSSPGNWWPNSVPQAGDVVWVKALNGDTILVHYSGATNPWLDKVHVDSVGTGKAVLIVASGDLLPVGQQNAGVFGKGEVWAVGGVHQVGDLNLGFWAGSDGTYRLRPSGVLTANQVAVGMGATGYFEHASGSSSIGGDLNVGFLNGAVGTYNLSGAAAHLSANKVIVGNAGDGVFYHSAAAITIPTEVTLGVWGSGDGRYELRDGGSITAGKVIVGGGGRGTFVQEDGHVDAGGDLVLGFLGGSAGAYQLFGPSTVESFKMSVGGAGWGSLTQDGGTTTVHTDLVVGNLGSGNGTYTLLDGLVTSNRQYVGGFGTGRFEHSGGTNDIAGLLQLGIWGSGNGTYALSGDGVLEVGTLYLGGFGVGHFGQTGGTAVIYGEAHISELPNVPSSMALSGGSFSADGLWNKTAGTFSYSGGDLASPWFSNEGVFNLSGEGVRLVPSNVTNFGYIEANETLVSYTGAFAHRGIYVSNETSQGFVDMVVTQNGRIIADGASTFTFTGDLLLNDAGNAWDTTGARLEFTESDDGTHVLHHAGQDLGASIDGYAGNFAWHALAVAAGESLALEGGALYVRVLDLEGGLPQIASLSGPENIYYDESLSENAYLDGQTYPLAGGGEVTPVPEPSVLLGLGAGILLLSRLRRKV